MLYCVQRIQLPQIIELVERCTLSLLLLGNVILGSDAMKDSSSSQGDAGANQALVSLPGEIDAGCGQKTIKVGSSSLLELSGLSK